MNLIENNVKKIISEQLGIHQDKILHGSSLTKNLGADSLDIIELIMSIEEKFEIEIKDEQIQKIITVKDIINCIKKIKQNV